MAAFLPHGQTLGARGRPASPVAAWARSIPRRAPALSTCFYHKARGSRHAEASSAVKRPVSLSAASRSAVARHGRGGFHCRRYKCACPPCSQRGQSCELPPASVTAVFVASLASQSVGRPSPRGRAPRLLDNLVDVFSGPPPVVPTSGRVPLRLQLIVQTTAVWNAMRCAVPLLSPTTRFTTRPALLSVSPPSTTWLPPPTRQHGRCAT